MGLDGRVALITGGANGIGAAAARRLAGQGARIVIADVDEPTGTALAEEVDGSFVRCDVRELADSEEAVAHAEETFGGLDIAFLNAGVSTGFGFADDFDLDRYRTAMGINLDGVVFGAKAAVPALRRRGGGDIVATASLAGLAAMPLDPVYGANKAAVVGLVRALGPLYAPEGIRVNGLCPGYAQTAIVEPIKELLVEGGMTILDVEEVVDAFMRILAADGTGECWFVQVGRPTEPFRFRNVPGPR
jgi:NAD(P)-dependent dehydrogenase (short-subunit alcohol dehydrogenase family)